MKNIEQITPSDGVEVERPGLVLDTQTFNWGHKNILYYTIISIYTIPVMLFCIYANYKYPAFNSLGYVLFGVAFCAIGTFVLITLLRNWEIFIKNQATIKKTELFSHVEEVDEELNEDIDDEIEPIESQHITTEEVENISTPFLDEIASLKILLEKQEESYRLEIETIESESGQKRQDFLKLEEELFVKRKEVLELAGEKKEGLSKSEHLEKELLAIKDQFRKQIEEKRNLLKEKEEVILRQNSKMDNSSKELSYLKERVTDLNFEIKTILQLDEMNLPLQEYTFDSSQDEELSKYSLLRHSLDLIQSIKGGRRLNSNLTNSIKYSVFDLRALQEKLTDIDSCLLILYSHVLENVIFVNSIVKELLNVTAEHFMHGFNELIDCQRKEWKEVVTHVKRHEEKDFNLLLKDKQSNEYRFESRLSIVHSGLFKGTILVVAIPEKVSVP
jgi:hypothetical protein